MCTPPASKSPASTPSKPEPAPWRGVPRNRHHDWDRNQVLHVAAVYMNPFRWANRRALFQDFRAHMATAANVVLHVVELAYGDRPFEVTDGSNPLDIQLRTTCPLFHKENLANIAIRHFPKGWKMVH